MKFSKNNKPTAYKPGKNDKQNSIKSSILNKPMKSSNKKRLHSNTSDELVKKQKQEISNNVEQIKGKNKQKFKNNTLNRPKKNHNLNFQKDVTNTIGSKEVGNITGPTDKPMKNKHKVEKNNNNNQDLDSEYKSYGSDKYNWRPELDGEMKKWYDEFPDEPTNFPKIEESEIFVLRNEAEQILRNEAEFYKKKQSKQGQSEKSWMKTVLTKGTASDKVAANVVTIQEAPAYNLSSIIGMVNMVKVAKKKECMLVMETLTELFLSDLLRRGRTLKTFEQHPLSMLNDLTSGNAVSRRHRLAYWIFEDHLKRLYVQFITAIDVVGKDTIESNREKAVTAMHKLLSGNMEQSTLLLKTLVNKLGDPSQKVASKVIYCLTQLLRMHPHMKQVVLNEIERLLFRPNIGAKTQYYGICFLSQYHFVDKDIEIAQNIITVYFSFFKANIKQGEVDSRMMAALLMGVNRAYPFAKLESDKLSEHIDTMFKLVHIASFNISVHALCLLYQIVGHSQDRFYVALYKKILDPHLAGSAHQAMFLNLLFKALSSDEDIGRVRVFIKRLLQICCHLPVPLVCGLLYTISHLISKRPSLLALTTHKGDTIYTGDEDSDGDEHYKDVPLQDQDLEPTDELKADNEIIEEKPNIKPGWHHNLNKTNRARNCNTGYDPTARNPAFAKGEKASYAELTDLSLHFHPTVSLFASKILTKQVITYTGDPLSDFTLVRFLERFVFKNPKQLAPGAGETGPDPALAQRKYYTPTGAKALPVDSEMYLSQAESKVPVDEVFLYRYLKQRNARVGYTKKDRDSDMESIASEDFEDMLKGMVGSSKKDLDFADDIADNLKKTKKTKGKKESESESEDESEAEGEDKDEETDLEGDDLTDLEDYDDEAIDFDGDDAASFDGEIDFNNLDEGIDHSKRKTKKKNVEIKKNKGKKNDNDIFSLFAPAEQFSEMLDEAGSSGNKMGTANALSNKDKAAKKQLDWETSRHHWVSKKRKHNQHDGSHKGKKRKY